MIANNLNENETANVLEDDKSFIMADWLEHVRAEIGVARSQSDAQIYNHLSVYLNTLITALRSVESNELQNENRVLSREHGEQRALSKGYTLEQMIHEYHLLRETIFEYLIVERDVNLTENDRKIINNFIDKSIEAAAAEFMKKATEAQAKIKAELEETLEKLKLTMKVRDSFLSVASHELKTPLTTLLLQTQMRKRQFSKGNMAAFGPEKLSEMFEADFKQLSGLNRLIDDMLDIGRIRTGRIELHKERLDLGVLAKEVFERFKPQIEEKCTSFDYTVEENIFVLADAARIEQIISNLLNNAMKYGRCRPLAARVFCDKENRKAFLVVRDNGLGINEEDKERIFQIFERAISPNEVSGLGLGLSIVKEFAEAHGGEVLVDSEVGVGSTFTVSLPLAPFH